MKKRSGPEAAPLDVAVSNGRLTISVGVKTLARAFEQTDYARPFDDAIGDWRQALKVVDPQVFAKEVALALMDEQEDGTTPVHLLLDDACTEACDQGAEGVAEVGADGRGGDKP